jgi:alpha-soluble NSF attachment protein
MFRYQKATELFEEIARKSINNNLLKYGVRGTLLNAGICQLCRGDAVAINNSLERYQVPNCSIELSAGCYCQLLQCYSFWQDIDPTFSGTREYKLLAVPYNTHIPFVHCVHHDT